MMMPKEKDERIDAMERLFNNQFTLEEAYELIHTVVAYNKTAKAIEEWGVVCGIMQVNDEVEVIVRFKDYIEQATKGEYLNRYLELES